MSELVSRVFALDDISIRSGGDGRTVTAYAAVFDTPAEIMDRDGHYLEQLSRSAFDKTIQERAGRIGVFYNHAKTLSGTPSERGSVPIGTPLEIKPDGRGLLTVTRYNRTQLADDILESIRNGDITGQSFTGRFIKSDPRGPYLRSGTGDLTLVTRQEVALTEYGPTPIPAYAEASIVGVRSEDQADEQDSDPENSERESIALSTSQEPTSAAARTEAGSEAATEPHTHSEPEEAPTTERKEKVMDQTTMTVEERAARQDEIRSRLTDLDAASAGRAFTVDERTEYDQLNEEHDAHERAIREIQERRQRLAALAGEESNTERVSDPRVTGRPSSRYAGVQVQASRRENIYDLGELRRRASSIDEVPALMRDNAKRAIEIADYAGVDNREDAQSRAERLLSNNDDENGTLARRYLTTGSPLYNRAFGKAMVRGSVAGLTMEEQRALSLGTASEGGYAVPFQLDPTVILTSSGVINPLRSLARVEQIVGKEWDGVTSTGITVTRSAEAAEATDNSPSLGQPTVKAERVTAFVPLSMEIEADWNGVRNEITRMLQDAKDTEEASSFINGNGTTPNPEGLLTGATNTTSTAAIGTLALDDLDSLEAALAPRFRGRASYVAERAFYVAVRNLARANSSAAGDPWVSVAGSPTGRELNGFPSAEASELAYSLTSSTKIAVLGDFRQFLIVDRIGMNVELIPHLFGTTSNYPTGQRGIFAIWRNNCKVLTPTAFRTLVVQ